MQDLINTQDTTLQKHRYDFIIMKSKNLIQYGRSPGITSDGSKIEDMSCYKKLPIIQNKPPKVEYEVKTPIQEQGLCPTPLGCWHALLDG